MIPHWRLPLLVVLALSVAVAGCARSTTSPVAPVASEARSAWLLGPELEAALPAPGREAESAGPLDRAVAEAAAAHESALPAARRPGPAGDAGASIEWNELTRALAAGPPALPPPLFSRAYALVAVACADAVEAASRGERAPSPTGCVVAGAASEVLFELFPAKRDVVEAALVEEARRAAPLGRGAIRRGLVLGRAAGRVAVRRAHTDGADTPFTGTIPAGPGVWTGTNPVLPMCGTWRTWVVTSGSEFPAEAPYAFGSPKDLVDVQAVVDAAAARTPEQVAIAHKWGDAPPPAIWNAMLNERIVARGLDAGAATRAHAWLNVAMYDGFVTCWATKYSYWTARPAQRIPGLVTVVPTPNFPSYTSGHSTISAAAAEVLAGIFPDEAPFFRAEAAEAARSRFYAGIHFPHDNDEGLAIGRKVGAKVVSRLREDRARHGAAPVVAARD